MASHKRTAVAVTFLAVLAVAHGVSLDELLDKLAGAHQQQVGIITREIQAAWQLNAGVLDLGSRVMRKWSLSGPIPPRLGNLTSLTAIHLQTNSLNGSIPPELGNLDRLTVLDLSNNRLSGSIPEELGKLQELSVLNLRGNQLSGMVPYNVLWKLPHLRWLDLSSNCLLGPISQLLSFPLKSVRILPTDHDGISTSRSSGETKKPQGASHPGFSSDQLLRLKSLDLANKTTLFRAALASQNQPRRYGSGSFQPKERLLDLSFNNLTGNISSNSSNYAGRLYFLNLSANNLSGAIPTELGLLTKLSHLDLSANPLLTGLFPRDFLHNRVCSPNNPSPLRVNLQGTGVRLDRATKEFACNPAACPTVSFLVDGGLYAMTGYSWGHTDLCVRLTPVRYLISLLTKVRYPFGVLVVQWFVVIGLALALTVSNAKRSSRGPQMM